MYCILENYQSGVSYLYLFGGTAYLPTHPSTYPLCLCWYHHSLHLWPLHSRHHCSFPWFHLRLSVVYSLAVGHTLPCASDLPFLSSSVVSDNSVKARKSGRERFSGWQYENTAPTDIWCGSKFEIIFLDIVSGHAMSR